MLSISLDKNKAKWEKKLAEDKPQWRQFICLDAFDSEVCKNYGINAIPRFLFFDKDGKVISLDAPRPSSAKITEYIDHTSGERQVNSEETEKSNTFQLLILSTILH